MAALPDISTLQGKKVSFTTKHPRDPVTWRGTIVSAAAAYVIASSYDDVTSYNAAVRLTDGAVPVDATTIPYFLIQLDNANNNLKPKAFSPLWIVDNTFKVLEEQVTRTVLVYDWPTNDANNILQVLKAAGYSAVFKT